jgi:hypothetical protein
MRSLPSECAFRDSIAKVVWTLRRAPGGRSPRRANHEEVFSKGFSYFLNWICRISLFLRTKQ